MYFVEEIKHYDVEYCAGGKNPKGYKYRVLIGLMRSDKSLIGGAYFHRDPTTMPNTDTLNARGYVSLHYPSEDFPKVLDLLRNESPVFVRYVGGIWNMGSITTSSEPVGESEMP